MSSGKPTRLRPETAPADESPLPTLPENQDAEQALLGAILFDNQQLEEVALFLRPEHFALEIHGRIYESIIKRIDLGQSATPVTLRPYFETDEALAEVGGAGYLTDLAASAVALIDVADYGHQIKDLALKRELFRVGHRMSTDIMRQEIEVSGLDILENYEMELFRLAETGESTVVSFLEAAETAVNAVERARQSGSQLSGITTGLIDLNNKLGGLHSTDLIVLAGRPSMGKTSLAVNIAERAAWRWQLAVEDGRDPTEDGGAPVAFFSLEMSADQLAKRILSEKAGVDSERLRTGAVSKDEASRLYGAAQEIKSLPLYIDDTASLTISELRTRARRLARQKRIGLVVVDYLQLLSGSRRRQNENRTAEVSEITRGLKQLAKELGIPVVALSQLSREVEKRENKRPQLSDLRESGSIEQDADVVLFLFREEVYHDKKKPDLDDHYYERWEQKAERLAGVAEIIVGKQRHGSIGTVRAHFKKETTSFHDPAQEDRFPDA